MAWIFFIFLLAWPFLELFVLVEIAGILGWPGAIFGLFASALLGLVVLQKNNLSVAAGFQRDLNRGELPMRALFDAAAAFSGLLLLIPGYLGTGLALLLFLPPVRSLVYGEMALKAKTRMYAARTEARWGPARSESGDTTIIDGDFTVVQTGEKKAADKKNDKTPPLLLL